MKTQPTWNQMHIPVTWKKANTSTSIINHNLRALGTINPIATYTLVYNLYIIFLLNMCQKQRGSIVDSMKALMYVGPNRFLLYLYIQFMLKIAHKDME